VFKRVARIALIAGGLVVLLMVLAMGWLKIHEDEIVFATARGREHLLAVLPADAQRATVTEPNGTALAALVYRADGNADSAFSPWQVRHCEALRGAGFNVLEIDYRGFGPTPGKPSEKAMYEDSEAAYQDLLRRGIPANRIILLGHSLGLYPYLPVRMVVGVQFNSLDRIGKVHIYSHALALFAAANEPKQLITFDGASKDRFGGHVDALYEHVDILRAALAKQIPALQSASNP
jgi:hypothetical protein